MFSKRTAWDRALNPLAWAAAEARAAGPRLDLTETNPTAVGLRAPDDILALLGDAGSAVYRPEAAGWAPAREAVAAEYGRHGVAISPEQVTLTASTSEAYAHLFKLLCDPGDAVLVPRPRARARAPAWSSAQPPLGGAAPGRRRIRTPPRAPASPSRALSLSPLAPPSRSPPRPPGRRFSFSSPS